MPRSRPRLAPPPRTAASSTRVRDYLLAIGGSLLGVAIVAVLRFGVFDGGGAGPASPRPSAEPAPAEDRESAAEAPAALSGSPHEQVEAADEPAPGVPRAEGGRRWLTGAAAQMPNVVGMAPGEPGYSPILEARQRFHEIERDWRARQQAGPDAWRAFLAEQAERHRAVARRARELSLLGEPELARRLKAEFTRLRAALAREAARPDGGRHLPQR